MKRAIAVLAILCSFYTGYGDFRTVPPMDTPLLKEFKETCDRSVLLFPLEHDYKHLFYTNGLKALWDKATFEERIQISKYAPSLFWLPRGNHAHCD